MIITIPLGTISETTIKRFWEKVGPHDDPNMCWLWMAASVESNHGGLRYGEFRVDDRMVAAHRLSYERHYHVIIPKGMTIDHVRARGCTSTLCVNPYHLEMVTMRVNVLRGDGPSAIHAKVTHCPYGHPYSEENTYVSSKGHRQCNICRRYRAKKQKIKLCHFIS